VVQQEKLMKNSGIVDNPVTAAQRQPLADRLQGLPDVNMRLIQGQGADAEFADSFDNGFQNGFKNVV
jgi:hypothetical protein